jgi:predicted nucleic acid-binding Zn ribbon protein
MKYSEASCFECGELLPPSRTDRQFCSGRCRSANFRRVQSEKLTMLERLFEQYVPKQEPVTKTKVDLFA